MPQQYSSDDDEWGGITEVPLPPRVRLRMRRFAAKVNGESDPTRIFAGYFLIVDGDDYVILDDDPALRAKPADFIGLSDGYDLNDPKIIEKFVEELKVGVNTPDFPVNRKPSIEGGLGFLTELDKVRTLFFAEPAHRLKKLWVELIIPFLTEHGSSKVFLVKTSHVDFYGRVATIKLSYLVEKLGGVDSAENKIFKERLLSGVLPSVFEPHDLFHLLMIARPYVFGFVFAKPGISLVAVPRRFSGFKNKVFAGLTRFLDLESRYQSSSHPRVVPKRVNFDHEVEEYVFIAARAANNYWTYFTDPMNWLDTSGEVSTVRAIRAMSAGRILMADYEACQGTSTVYATNRLAIAFFDKLANLLCESLSGRRNLEKVISSAFMHPDMVLVTAQIFRSERLHCGKKY